MNYRLIGVAVAAVIVFLAGWTVRGWKADSDMTEVVQAHQAERDARIKATNEALAAADASGRAAAVQYETRIREISTASQKLKTELRNAESNARASGAAVCPLPSEWVRLYDDALRPGSGASAPTGKPTDSSQGAGSAGSGTSPANEWDVAWVHAENASRWAECRAQLNALIDFELGDGKSVVTPESTR